MLKFKIKNPILFLALLASLDACNRMSHTKRQGMQMPTKSGSQLQETKGKQEGPSFNLNLYSENNKPYYLGQSVCMHSKVGSLVTLLSKLLSKDMGKIALFHQSKNMDWNKTLGDYGITSSKELVAFSTSQPRSTRLHTLKQINNKEDFVPVIPINSYHVSCESYRPKSMNGNENLGGIVLYAYEGSGNWFMNSKNCQHKKCPKEKGLCKSCKHCQSGYVILKRSEEAIKERSSEGKVHGGVYKSVFGEEPDTKRLVGSGFSYKNREWKWRSGVFNQARDSFHSRDKPMNILEQKWVKKALENWINNKQQTTYVTKDQLVVCSKKEGLLCSNCVI